MFVNIIIIRITTVARVVPGRIVRRPSCVSWPAPGAIPTGRMCPCYHSCCPSNSKTKACRALATRCRTSPTIVWTAVWARSLRWPAMTSRWCSWTARPAQCHRWAAWSAPAGHRRPNRRCSTVWRSGWSPSAVGDSTAPRRAKSEEFWRCCRPRSCPCWSTNPGAAWDVYEHAARVLGTGSLRLYTRWIRPRTCWPPWIPWPPTKLHCAFALIPSVLQSFPICQPFPISNVLLAIWFNKIINLHVTNSNFFFEQLLFTYIFFSCV